MLRRASAARNSPPSSARLTELIVAKLAPIRAEMIRLAEAPDHVDAVLAQGGERAREIARPVMASVKDILGLVR